VSLHFLIYVIPGIPYGCIFGLVAASLVLTFKTSGVFNLGFGAQAYVSATVFYILVEQHHWSKPLGFLVSVVLIAPLLGLLLDRLLFRHMRNKSWAVKLITALGLTIGIPPIVQFLAGQGQKLRPPSIAPRPDHFYRWGRYSLDGSHLAAVLVTVAVIVLLGLFFRFSNLGLKMRAVVESSRMVELTGINADRIGAVSWAMSSFVAGLAGVLLAPIYSSLNVYNFNTVLVAAIAAAAIARLRSLPMALLGGIVLGVGAELLAGYLPLNGVIATGLRPSFPFLVLVVMLLVSPALHRGQDTIDPLAAVDPPAPALASATRSPTLDRISRIAFAIFLVVFMGVALFSLANHWLFIVTIGLVYTIIFLSITIMTGMSGQISLCQATFAGVGAFTAGQLATHHGVPFVLAMVVGGVVAAGVGAVVALPALRLSGLYLALATLAFALVADNVIFPAHGIGGGEAGLDMPRPQIGPISFNGGRSFFLFVMAVFALLGGVVILIRKGTTGRYLAAMRGSELAAATVGINPARAKITVFALSAGVAGIGGALLGSLQGHTDLNDFNYFISLAFMVLVLTTGSRTVDGAVNAGMAFAFLPEILAHFPPKYSVLEFALFGYGAVNYAKHPEGIVEYQKRRSMQAVDRLLTRRQQRRGVSPSSTLPSTPEGDGPLAELMDTSADAPAAPTAAPIRRA
jgi:branched-chain amino acid transport system permease protein